VNRIARRGRPFRVKGGIRQGADGRWHGQQFWLHTDYVEPLGSGQTSMIERALLYNAVWEQAYYLHVKIAA
jgi:hypothetical protein